MSSTAAARNKSRAKSRDLVPLKIFISIGLLLIFTGLAVLILTFFPVATAELRYWLFPPDKNATVVLASQQALPGQNVITPVDRDFGIVIPKIGANAKVVANVDPYNQRAYEWALTKGVAQAKGTAFPGEDGNIFIFAHSAGNFYEANRFNAIFYLLTKLEKGDLIYLFYKEGEYKYSVTDKKLVDASSVSYLSKKGEGQILTLMTCWPPGTTLKRLIILAKPSS